MLTYLHTQATPSAIWTINHNLNLSSLMIETFIDVSGTPSPIVPAKITKTTANQVVVVFTIPRAGTARLLGSSGAIIDYSNYTPPIEREIDYSSSPQE